MVILVVFLFFLHALETLKINVNYLSLTGCRALAATFHGLHCLKQLSMGSNQIDDACCAALALTVFLLTQLHSIDFSRSTYRLHSAAIIDAGCVSLSAVFRYLINLASVDFHGNEIGGRRCSVIIESCEHLTSLLFDYNKIGDAGCAEMARRLSQHPQLTSINLRSNQIGVDGCRALATAIQSLPAQSLCKFSLASNPIPDAGCTILLPALSRLTSLESFDCSCCQLGDPSFTEISEALHNGEFPALKSVSLYDSPSKQSSEPLNSVLNLARSTNIWFYA